MPADFSRAAIRSAASVQLTVRQRGVGLDQLLVELAELGLAGTRLRVRSRGHGGHCERQAVERER